MENHPEKSLKKIKTGAIIIMAGAGYLIISNTLGAIAWNTMEVQEIFQRSEIPMQGFEKLLAYYIEICISTAVMGLLYLIGGFFLYRLQHWAARWLTIIAVISMIGGISLSIWVGSIISEFLHPMIAAIIMMIASSFELAPLIFMIWFLNRKSTKIILSAPHHTNEP